MLYDILLEGSVFHSLHFLPGHKNQKMKNGARFMRMEKKIIFPIFLIKVHSTNITHEGQCTHYQG